MHYLQSGNMKEQRSLTTITAVRRTEHESPRHSYASYTLDRKRKNTNTNLKRKTPTSSARSSPATSPFLSHSSRMLGAATNGDDSRSRESQSQTSSSGSSGKAPDHFRMLLSPDEREPPVTATGGLQRNPSQGAKTKPADGDANARNLAPPMPKPAENQLASNSLHKKFGSESNLASTLSVNTNLDKSWTSSQELRDSGFQDQSETESQNNLPLELSAQTCTIDGTTVYLRRRRSVSTENVSKSLQTSKRISTSVPSLAVHTRKAKGDQGDGDQPNLNAAKLKSYKSMELLTGEDFEAIQSNLTTDSQSSSNLDSVPRIPKRISSHIENCTVSDDYLLKQGKRLSQILNLCPPKKSEKNHFRQFMNKITGTLLKKNKSVCTSPPIPTLSQCELGSPAAPSYPTGPPPPVAPRPDLDIPSPMHSSYISANSIQSGPISLNSSAVAQLGSRQPKLQPLPASPGKKKQQQQPDYLQIVSPATSSSKPRLPAYENHDLDENSQNFYQVPPLPKDGTDTIYENNDLDVNSQNFYQVPPSPNERGTIYENNDLDENLQNYYQVPPTPHQKVTSNSYENHEAGGDMQQSFYDVPPLPKLLESTIDSEEDSYENKGIACGPKNEITFNNNPLHIYSTPKSVTPVSAGMPNIFSNLEYANGMHKKTTTYENNEIQSSPKDGISIGGEELHVYQVPPVQVDPAFSRVNVGIPPPPPPPPVLPPKPLPQAAAPSIPPPTLPPKPTQTINVPAPPPLPPKPPSDLSSTMPPPSDKSSSVEMASITERQQAPSKEGKAPATAPKPSRGQNRAVRKTSTHTYPPSQNNPNTFSTNYYDYVADWIATLKDGGDYSKLDRNIKQRSQKDSTSNLDDDAFTTEDENLFATASEPDLRDSQIYYVYESMEPEDEYIAMAAVGPIRRSSLGEVRVHQVNSKGQRAPKCLPKPALKKALSSSTNNIRDKIVALNRDGIRGPHTANQSSAKPLPLPPTVTSASNKSHPARPTKLPILPPTTKNNNTPTLVSTSSSTSVIDPPPQFAVSSPSISIAKSVQNDTQARTFTPSVAASPLVLPSPITSTPGSRAFPPLPTPISTSYNGPIPSPVTTPGFRAIANSVPSSLSIPTSNSHKGPIPSPTTSTPGLRPVTQAAAATIPSPLSTPVSNRGPLPPPSPPPPPPPSLATLPRSRPSTASTPVSPTRPLTFMPTSFSGTTATANSSSHKGPLPPPPPPPPPPLATLPTSSTAPISPTLPCTFSDTMNSPIPPPPPPISTIPRTFAQAPPSIPPPPPGPPPAPQQLPPQCPSTFRVAAPQAPPPPPPPPIGTPTGLKTMKKASSAAARLGGPKLNKPRPPLKSQRSEGKSPAELLSAELFERIKGLAKRLDNETSEEHHYGNMA